MKPQVLVVRNGLEGAAPSIARVLRDAGMDVRTITDVELADAAPADVVLLAIPARDPVATCWAMHRLGYRWVVAASARPQSQECITMLNAGADYYLDAWLSAAELVARGRGVLRFFASLAPSHEPG